jgi:Fic family protein
MNGIRDDAGFYRRHGVRIVGADIATANYAKVPELMERLVADIQADEPDAIRHAAAIHARFEQIHPFSDGNGRIGRLLVHAMLFRHNIPPVIVRPRYRLAYYAALSEAQRTGDTARLEGLLCDGILESGRILTDDRADA